MMDENKEKNKEDKENQNNKEDKRNTAQKKIPKKENEKTREDYLIDSTRVFCYSFVNEYLMEHIENRINENLKQQDMVTKNYQESVLKTLGFDEKSKRKKAEEKNGEQNNEDDNFLAPQEQKRILDQLDKNYKEAIEILENEEVMLRQYKSDYLYSLNIYNEDESLNLTTNIPNNCFLMDILKAVAIKPLHVVTIDNSKKILKSLLDDHINLYFHVVVNEKERQEFTLDEAKRIAKNSKEASNPKDNTTATYYKNLLRQQNYLKEAFKKLVYYDSDAEASDETELDDSEKEIVRKLYMSKISEEKRKKYPLYSIKQIVILENYTSVVIHLSKDTIFRNTMPTADLIRIVSDLTKNAISIYGYDDIFATKNREETLCFDENLRTRDGYFNSILFLDNTNNRLFVSEDITEYAEIDAIEQNEDIPDLNSKMPAANSDNSNSSEITENVIFKPIDDINKPEEKNKEKNENHYEEEVEQYIVIPVKNLIKSSSHMYYIGVSYCEENGTQKGVIFGVKEKDILRYKGRNMFIVKDNYYKKYNLYLKDSKELNGSYVEIDDYISKAFLLEHFKTITSSRNLKEYIKSRSSDE